MYRGGLRAPGAPPQPLGAPLRDVKTMAPPEAARPDPAAGLSIYKDDPNAPAAAPAFVSPPEQPAARPKPPQTIDQILANPPAAPQPAGPSDGLVATAKPAAARSASSPVKAAGPSAKDAQALGKMAGSTPRSAPAAAKTGSAAAGTKPPAGEAKAAAGAFTIQIGAFSSSALANKGLDQASAAAGGLASGKSRHVSSLDKEDGTRLYRATIGGFATREAAVAACAKIKAAGKTCLVR